MCKRASCNGLCYITRYINCQRLLNYIVLLWTLLCYLLYFCTCPHALHYYCLFIFYFFGCICTDMVNKDYQRLGFE